MIWALVASASFLTAASSLLIAWTISRTALEASFSCASCLASALFVYSNSSIIIWSSAQWRTWLSINSDVFRCVSSNFTLCSAILRHSLWTASLPFFRITTSFEHAVRPTRSTAFCESKKSFSFPYSLASLLITFISRFHWPSTGFSYPIGEMLRPSRVLEPEVLRERNDFECDRVTIGFGVIEFFVLWVDL